MRTLVRGILSSAILLAPVGAAAQLACGDVLERKTLTLASDLDCTGLPGAALTLAKSTLKMNGFTIRGGEGVKCAERCSIKGPGTIEDSSASGIWSDLWYRTKYRVAYVTVRHNALWGVAGFTGVAAGQSEVSVHGSTIEENGLSGVIADRSVKISGSVVRNNGTANGGAGAFASSGSVKVGKSRIEGNRGRGLVALGDVGVAASVVSGNEEGGIVAGEGCFDPRGDARVVRSVVTGNATAACGPGECTDVASCARPRVIRSTCDTSHRIASGTPGDDWNVCALD